MYIYTYIKYVNISNKLSTTSGHLAPGAGGSPFVRSRDSAVWRLSD